MKPATVVLAALFLLAAGCGPDPEQPAPESKPASRAATSFEVVVESDPGWDAAFVARRAGAELATCRAIIERRLGLPAPDPGVLIVEFVHDAGIVRTRFDATPASEQVLWWGGTSFLHLPGRRVVFARDAEIRERAYMMNLALLLVHFRVDPVRFVDSCALWLTGLALNQLGGAAAPERSRVPSGLSYALHGDLGSRAVAAVCAWGRQPIGATAHLDWDPPGVDPAFADIDVVDRPRTRAWWLVYFLATFDVDGDGRVRFDRTPKYDGMLRNLLGRRDSAHREGPCAHLSVDPTMLSELQAYQQFVLRKIGLGQSRMGALIAWDEYVNRAGTKTGQKDDDLLRPR